MWLESFYGHSAQPSSASATRTLRAIRDSAARISLAGTPEHASSRRSAAAPPLDSTYAASISKRLMEDHSAAASTTLSGWAAAVLPHAATTRAATSAHRRPPRNPILRLHPSRIASASPSGLFAAVATLRGGGPAAADSEVERQDEDASEWS